MNRFQKIIMGLLILAVVFLAVFSKIQMGYAEKEGVKARLAEQLADQNAEYARRNAMKAEEMAALAQKAQEEAFQQVERLRAELEACKKKNN